VLFRAFLLPRIKLIGTKPAQLDQRMTVNFIVAAIPAQPQTIVSLKFSGFLISLMPSTAIAASKGVRRRRPGRRRSWCAAASPTFSGPTKPPMSQHNKRRLAPRHRTSSSTASSWPMPIVVTQRPLRMHSTRGSTSSPRRTAHHQRAMLTSIGAPLFIV
jgi:hypothetical protein